MALQDIQDTEQTPEEHTRKVVQGHTLAFNFARQLRERVIQEQVDGEYGQVLEYRKIFMGKTDIDEFLTVEEYTEGDFVKYISNNDQLCGKDSEISNKAEGAIEVSIATMCKGERCPTDEVYVVGFVPSFLLPCKRSISLDPFLDPLIREIEGFIHVAALVIIVANVKWENLSSVENLDAIAAKPQFHGTSLNAVKNHIAFLKASEEDSIDWKEVDSQLRKVPWTHELRAPRTPQCISSRCGYWKAEEYKKFAFPASEVALLDHLSQTQAQEWLCLCRIVEYLQNHARDKWSESDADTFHKMTQMDTRPTPLDVELNSIVSLLGEAAVGDPVALRRLRLHEGCDFVGPQVFNPITSMEDVESDLVQMIYFCASIQHLQLQHMEKCTLKALSYMLYVYECLLDKSFLANRNLEGSEVSAGSGEILQDIIDTVEMLREAKQRHQEKVQKRGESNVKRVPSEEEDTSNEEWRPGSSASDSSEDESSDGKGGAGVKGVAERKSLGKESADKGGAGVKGVRAERKSLEEESAVCREPQGEVFQTKKTEMVVRGKQRSKKVDRTCKVPSCKGYTGPNLKRHLMDVHLNKKEIFDEHVDRLFNMGLSKTPLRGPPRKNTKGRLLKGRRKRWCPEPFCGFLGSYLPQHLKAVHNLTPGSERYKVALKEARPYRGEQEELASLTPPRPPVVLVKWSKSAKKRPLTVPPHHTISSDDSEDKLPAKASKTSITLSEDIVPPTPPQPEQMEPCTTAPDPTCSEDSEDELPETEYANEEAYFLEPAPSTPRHAWLVGFYKYLNTPAAGFHKDRNRLQHACQVKTLLNEVDPSGVDIQVLDEEEGSRVWLDWVKPNLSVRAAGTLKSYLNSLQKFLEFVTKKGKRDNLPVISEETKNVLSDLCSNLKGWRRYIAKETSASRFAKYLREADHLLTTPEVEEIMVLGPANDGRVALIAADSATSAEQLSIQQYSAARDFLLVMLTRTVGTRPGALESATLAMFNSSLWDENKTRRVMLVASHKREVDGPAPIPMDPYLFYLMGVFIKKLRPLVTTDCSPSSPIFVKSDGAPYARGTIGRRISAFIVKSGIRADKPIMATDFRKWIVTTMKSKKRAGEKIDEDLLRRLMCHSEKTPTTWYLREDLTEQAAQASQQIAANTAVTPTREIRPKIATTPYATRRRLHSVASVASPCRSLTSEEKGAVERCFSEEIKKGFPPAKEKVIAAMKANDVLGDVADSEDKVKKVVDRVRYIIKAQPTVELATLEEEPASVRTEKYVQSHPPLTSSAVPSGDSGRVEWSLEDSQALEAPLSAYEKQPTNLELRAIMSSSDTLRRILEENSFQRIRNKQVNPPMTSPGYFVFVG
ncbi:hypothetical protein AWC38_SpisGene18303 [Stylophora pistillata]|uniref:Uncharacterized protein n=1 Tax=Stylophora pistillata TaxID=50429 RepID=A0A2B4RM03_STYPI|nr:hypothetical protein AWC38_SpisGene18303 [Stylophora pistillata]